MTMTRSISIPSEASFGTDDYRPASELETLAAHLIGNRPRIGHVADVRLSVLWKRKGGASRGAARLGQCKRAAGLEKHWGEVDFIVWLAADHLRGRDERDIAATLYHELLHIGTHPDTGDPMLVEHDFTGFTDEVREFGLWRADLEVAHAAFVQLALPGYES